MGNPTARARSHDLRATRFSGLTAYIITRLSACVSLIVLAAPLETNNAQADDASTHFAVGQEWSIKSEAPTTAKVIIDRVESWRDKTVIHISIIDIPAMRYKDEKSMITRIDHLPFEESALAASVDKLLLTGVPPPAFFEAGYQQWKDHKGGIYTITVMELLNTNLPN